MVLTNTGFEEQAPRGVKEHRVIIRVAGTGPSMWTSSCPRDGWRGCSLTPPRTPSLQVLSTSDRETQVSHTRCFLTSRGACSSNPVFVNTTHLIITTTTILTIPNFHCFCLEKAQNFPAASRRGCYSEKLSLWFAYKYLILRYFCVEKTVKCCKKTKGFQSYNSDFKKKSGDACRQEPPPPQSLWCHLNLLL